MRLKSAYRKYRDGDAVDAVATAEVPVADVGSAGSPSPTDPTPDIDLKQSWMDAHPEIMSDPKQHNRLEELFVRAGPLQGPVHPEIP